MTAPAIETVPHWDLVECGWCCGMPDPDCSVCRGTGDEERRISISRCCGTEVRTCGQCGEDECGCTSLCTCKEDGA